MKSETSAVEPHVSSWESHEENGRNVSCQIKDWQTLVANGTLGKKKTVAELQAFVQHVVKPATGHGAPSRKKADLVASIEAFFHDTKEGVTK